MYARTTLFEIDTLRTSTEAVLDRFCETVMPQLREQPGCQGVMVLETPEGRGLLITMWRSVEAMTAGIETGLYDEQVRSMVTFLRQPPGREHYEVSFFELSDEIVTGRAVRAGVDSA
jgi:heme-degrading monooxygenase HmoA